MNSFFSIFRRSWQMLASSYATLARQPRLVVFPLLALGTGTLIGLCFLVALLNLPSGHALWDAVSQWRTLPEKIDHWRIALHTTGHANPPLFRPWSNAGYLYFVGLYLVSMFITTFLNVSLYSQVIKALAGESVSVAGGLRFGLKRIRSVMVWSLFAGTVGLLLQKLEQRLGLFGKLGLNLFGTMWSVACIFVIPVIIREDNSNPLSLIRNSAATIRKTWGEVLVGFAGITIGSFLVVFAWSALVLELALLSKHTPYAGLVPLIGLIWLLAVVAWLCVTRLANAIFRCALYVYATEGVVPEPYTVDLMDTAWKVKK